MKPTKKRKNTYVIQQNVFVGYSVFELCQSTPLAVVEINGKSLEQKTGWLNSLDFPNPGAIDMIKSFKVLEPVMGKKLASTIVEYLDKETGEPVAMLFPTNDIMYREDLPDFLNRLNHMSRKDLHYQMMKRARYLNLLQKNKQK